MRRTLTRTESVDGDDGLALLAGAGTSTAATTLRVGAGAHAIVRAWFMCVHERERERERKVRKKFERERERERAVKLRSIDVPARLIRRRHVVHGSSTSGCRGRRSGRSGLGTGVRLVLLAERDGHHHGSDGDGSEDSVVELHVDVCFVL